MQRSTGRILTTHTGSLPRPTALVQMVEDHEQREVRAHPGFTSQVHTAVAEVVHKQANIGIDVLSEGEVYKAARLLNFALGDCAMFAARLAAAGWHGLGLGLVGALGLGCAGMVALAL